MVVIQPFEVVDRPPQRKIKVEQREAPFAVALAAADVTDVSGNIVITAACFKKCTSRSGCRYQVSIVHRRSFPLYAYRYG